MAIDKDTPIFDNISFSDIAKNIYKSKQEKDKAISDLVATTSGMVKTPHDATIIIPVIKEYLEVGVKNDEILVKLAVVIQRIMSDSATSSESDDFGMTPAERERFMKDMQGVIDSQSQVKLPSGK